MQNQFLPSNYRFDIMSVFKEQKKEKDSLPQIRTRVYEKQEYIYNLGDDSDKVYIIKKGRVKVKKDADGAKVSVIKNVFTVKELFGEFALLGECFRADCAIAMEKTELYILSPDELFRQMQYNYNLTAYIIYLLGTRSIATEQKIESIVFKKSRTRIIEFLINLANKRGQKIGYEILVRNFLTHQDIADITATSRQTVTTVLNELRNKSILIFNRRRLLFRDLLLLKAEASS